MKKLILLIMLATLACQKPFCEDQSDQTGGIVVRYLEKLQIAYDQKQGEDLGRFGIRISDSEQYKRVFSYCCQNRLDSIDFTRYDILGLSTVNRGSHSSYIRAVKQDDVTKIITYTVTEEYCNRASPSDGKGNFVLVPKLPTEYKIAYTRNQ